MKKFLALLIALILGMFSTTATMAETVDTPEEVKVIEWAIGYHKRCHAYHGKVQPRNWTPVKQFARRVALAPMRLFVGVALADTTPDERFWSTLAKGGTKEEATAAYNAVDESEVKKPKTRRISHPRWSTKVDPERVGFLSAEDLNNVIKAKRGWFSASKLNGFDDTTVLAYQWYKPDDIEPITEPPKYIVYDGIKRRFWCAGQGGLKKGSGLYLPVKFLRTKTNGVKNEVLLDAPKGLPMNRVNQIRALRFTACQPTKATRRQLIVLKAKQRTDKAEDVVDGRPTILVDVTKGYAISKAKEILQALADGFLVYFKKSGIDTPVGQFRDDGDLKAAGMLIPDECIGDEIEDAFGRMVAVKRDSIISTTDNHKSIKLFLKKVENGEMTGEEAWNAWNQANGGLDSPIYSCPVHPQNGRVTLGRQIFGKLSQLSNEALFKVISKDLGKLAEMGFESGYKRALQRKYAALRIPELAAMLDHPLLYQDMIKTYLSRWHDIASGTVEVNGSLALAVIDPAWFVDVYLKGKAVDDPTAGKVAPGTILFGTKNKEGVNPYLGKKVVLARFPQVKSGLPVVTVVGDAPASGVVVISGRPGDMVLQDLDADLDGDKLYVIDQEEIVEAVERANKLFNFPHVIFTKWETVKTKETLEEYVGRNAQWQNEESVGTFATHQFVIDEMVPLLEEGQDWKTLLRPTLDENGEYSDFVTLEIIFELNILLGVAGNMATDSGKLNHKPDAPQYITKKVAFRPMSQRDAHPNTPDSGFKKRLAAFLPDKYPLVEKGILKRDHDMLMTYIPIQETGRSDVNDFDYDDNGKIRQDVPLALYRPTGFEPVEESVWKHTFGNELDQIKTSLLCFPNDAETVELNADLLVFEDASEGISLVTYFSKYASRIVAIESNLDDDKKGWTVAGRDTFGDNLIRFVQTAIGRKDVSADDCLWLAYNALCNSFIGTESQSRGTAFAVSQFLKLFEGMLIAQVCANTKTKPPKVFGDRVSIKDSVSKSKTENVNVTNVETTDEEPPFNDIGGMELQKQLLAEIAAQTTDEKPPTEKVDVTALFAKLQEEIDDTEEYEEEE